MDFNKFNFDLKQLRSFHEICREESFTRASRLLKISQSTISHQINQLEKTFGADLFTRSSKEFSITEEGKLLLNFCESLFHDIDQLVQAISHDTEGGFEHIASSTIPAVYVIPEAIACLRKKHPQFFYRVSSQDSREVIEQIKQGSVRIGIAGKKLSHPSLHYEKIFSDSLILIGPKSVKKNIELHEIKELPLIIRERGSGSGDIVKDFLEENNIFLSECSIVHWCSSTESMIRAVAAGAGYAFVSSLALSENNSIQKISIDDTSLKRNFYLIYAAHKKLSHGEHIFIDEIKSIAESINAKEKTVS